MGVEVEVGEVCGKGVTANARPTSLPIEPCCLRIQNITLHFHIAANTNSMILPSRISGLSCSTDAIILSGELLNQIVHRFFIILSLGFSAVSRFYRLENR